MKFKKLVLISVSTLITSTSLIVLAAACHDKNQKKPGNGNNKEVKTDNKTSENKDQQSTQKQNINPELKQKQTNRNDEKQQKETLSTSPTLKQEETNKNQKDQLSKQDSNSSESSKQKINPSESNKNNENQNLNATPNMQQEQKQTEQKQQENTSNNSTEENKQDLNTLSNQQKEPELNQKDQSTETPENDKNKLNDTEKTEFEQENSNKKLDNKTSQEITKKEENVKQEEQNNHEPEMDSDVEFLDHSPTINQEADYSGYLKLKIKDELLNSDSSKLFTVTLISNKNLEKKIEVKGYGENSKEHKNIVIFSLTNINPDWTYQLESVTISNQIKQPEQSIEEKSLQLSKKVKETQISVKQINHSVQLDQKEQEKIPVTVSAELIKKDSDYKIKLSFSANENSEINEKYVSLIITYGDYSYWSTIESIQLTNYKINMNKIIIPISSNYINKDKEFQVKIQRIADSEESYIKSNKFRLNYKSKNGIVDREQNLIFKLSDKKITT